jgi:alpha-beta hydrolase superfamily lysophospholipase
MLKRMRRCLCWSRAHLKLVLTLALGILIVLVNAVAYLHAYSMTHFTQAGTRTARPEDLSLLGKANVLLTGVKIPKPVNETSPAALGLPFEVQHFAGKDGIDLEAWHIPHADARGLILMFHGYATCKAALLPEAKALHELGYALLLVDFRGSGGSSGSDTSIGFAEAEDVVAAVAHARLRWQQRPLVLFGRSMGSAAILRAIAVHGLEADAIMLECPFDRLLSTVENRFTAIGVPSFPFARLLLFWGGVQCGFPAFTHNPVDYAEHARCPVLLLHGRDDQRVSEAQAQQIFDRFPGPKQFERFDDVNHGSLYAARPEQWTRSVRQFLRSGMF